MRFGDEISLSPGLSRFERWYIELLGAPIVALRVRARAILRFLPDVGEPRRIAHAGSGRGVMTLAYARAFRRAETLANDLSYLITGGRERHNRLYASAFPLLLSLATNGGLYEPRHDGSGLVALGRRPLQP